jgi:hypothetical protein
VGRTVVDAREEGLGGAQSVENVTVERGFDPTRDWALAKRLRAKTGQARAAVTKQPLDRTGVPLGDPEVFTGTPGQYVSIGETIRGFREILDGKHDDVAEGNFYMKGGIDMVRA